MSVTLSGEDCRIYRGSHNQSTNGRASIRQSVLKFDTSPHNRTKELTRQDQTMDINSTENECSWRPRSVLDRSKVGEAGPLHRHVDIGST